MGPTEQQSAPAQPGAEEKCASCGAPLAADQRYCLACGARRGAPRVPLAPTAAERASAEATTQAQANRPADVSPLAAVIGIALLGGMLLIGVLIGRGEGGDETTPTAVVQVGEGTTTATAASGDGSGDGPTAVTSEWPAGTDGFTVQLSSLTKSSATPESVDAAKQSAADEGAPAAAVLDSDLYPSLPAESYILYSGVYNTRRDAEAALGDLSGSFPEATVVEVSASSGDADTDTDTDADAATPNDLGESGELELPPEASGNSGGVTESEK